VTSDEWRVACAARSARVLALALDPPPTGAPSIASARFQQNQSAVFKTPKPNAKAPRITSRKDWDSAPDKVPLRPSWGPRGQQSGNRLGA